MTQEKFVEDVNGMLGYCCDLLLRKGAEYNADTVDRLAAFKQAGAMERTTPQRALFGMLAKHLVSIQNMTDNRILDYSQPKWTEKIGDAINYLVLLHALVAETYEEASHEKH